jgi:hypothetical protein
LEKNPSYLFQKGKKRNMFQGTYMAMMALGPLALDTFGGFKVSLEKSV